MLSLIASIILAPPAIERGVIYAKVGEDALMMDVFRPNSTAGSPVPAVVVIHGGAWISGKRQDMDALAQTLANEGVLAATVSYRLAPKHKWPAMLDDVQTAVRFLRMESKRFNIDASKIGAAGASAGGHLALLLGYRDTRDPKPAQYSGVSSKVRAVLNLFGPTDMSRDFGPMYDPLYLTLLGKPRKDAAAEIRDASPVTFIDAKSAPTFTFHGDKDVVVPVAQARWLDEKLAAAKIERETVIVEGIGHEVPMDKPAVADALKRGVAFLLRHLGVKAR